MRGGRKTIKQTHSWARAQCRARSHDPKIVTWAETKSGTLTDWVSQEPHIISFCVSFSSDFSFLEGPEILLKKKKSTLLWVSHQNTKSSISQTMCCFSQKSRFSSVFTVEGINIQRPGPLPPPHPNPYMQWVTKSCWFSTKNSCAFYSHK